MAVDDITEGEVVDTLRKGTQGGDYDNINSPSLSIQIRLANSVGAKVFACAVKKRQSYTVEDKKLLKILLAAHFYCMVDRQYTSKTTVSSGTFNIQGGLQLDGSSYGQNAKLFDTTGCLNAYDKHGRASIAWGGKARHSQLDYDERN